MTDPSDAVDLAALAGIAAELAEHLRVEHEVGSIGVLKLERAPAAATARPALAGSAPIAARAPSPAPATAPRTASPASAGPARPEVSASELDALLAQARRARTAPRAGAADAETVPAASAPSVTRALLDDGRLAVLERLSRDAAACTACRLHESRTKSVFARGSAAAEVAFVGEGPGFHEDQTGEPFVGAAGQLLDKMISAMGLERGEAYICNVVKCRPPENRTPMPDEASACAPFLDGQLAAVAPRVIVALGRSAAERLGCAEAGRSWRGTWSEYRGVPVMPTYHPAFLLRNAEMKRPVWEDLQKVTARLVALRGGSA